MTTRIWAAVGLAAVLSAGVAAAAEGQSQKIMRERVRAAESERLRAVVLYYRRTGHAEAAEYYRMRAEEVDATKVIYVPMIKSDPAERGEALRLTELLIKSIERETPHKVVGSPEGVDMVLEATLYPAARPDR